MILYPVRNSSHGMTPLHLAARNGHYSLLAFLLSHQQTPEMTIEIIDHKHVCLKTASCANIEFTFHDTVCREQLYTWLVKKVMQSVWKCY